MQQSDQCHTTIMSLAENIVVLLFSTFVCVAGEDAPQIQPQFDIVRLPALNTNRNLITVSGFSSGGTFAQQLYIAHSSLFRGIATFSHSYYRCGPITSALNAYNAVCTKLNNQCESQLYDPNNAIADIEFYRNQGWIDNPSNLLNKPLYIYAGTNNSIFSSDMSLRVMQIFEPYVQNQNAIRTRVQHANQVFPTKDFGGPCSTDANNNFFLANCGISGALDALQFLLGHKAVKMPQANIALQPIFTFDQTEFFYGLNGRHDMDRTGYLYVPATCQTNAYKCPLHLYFHGCLTGREFVGSNHILNSGFLQVAEENNIIMVFPQAAASEENPIGCWDHYGFTGNFYATKLGTQVTVIRNMLSRILGEPEVGNSVFVQQQNSPSFVESKSIELATVQNIPASMTFHDTIEESSKETLLNPSPTSESDEIKAINSIINAYHGEVDSDK